MTAIAIVLGLLLAFSVVLNAGLVSLYADYKTRLKIALTVMESEHECQFDAMLDALHEDMPN